MHLINCNGKVFTKNELVHANNAAIREKRNQAIKGEFVNSLPEEGLFPIGQAFDEHNKGEVRVKILFDEEGQYGLLDLSKTRYDQLPIAEIINGNVQLTYTSEQLYPEGREYVEKVVRKVVRQKKFRRQVLSAYGNQCAMCDVSEVPLLRAAHIYPAHLCADDTINNGICLCANHDAAYEKGSVCITPDGEIRIYSDKIVLNRLEIRLPRKKKDYPSPERLRQRQDLSLSKIKVE